MSRVSNSERMIAPQSSCLYLIQTVHPLYVCLLMNSWRLFRMETLTDRRYAPSLRWISRIIHRRSCNLWVGPRSHWILVSFINACCHSRRKRLPMPASPPFFDDSSWAERPGVAGLEGCGEGARLKLSLIPLNLSFSLSPNLRFGWIVSFEGFCMVVESKVWKQRVGV